MTLDATGDDALIQQGMFLSAMAAVTFAALGMSDTGSTHRHGGAQPHTGNDQYTQMKFYAQGEIHSGTKNLRNSKPA